jgi:hypothetical protein
MGSVEELLFFLKLGIYGHVVPSIRWTEVPPTPELQNHQVYGTSPGVTRPGPGGTSSPCAGPTTTCLR